MCTHEAKTLKYIFDDDDEMGWSALHWRECTVPVEEFGFSYPSIEEYVMALCRVTLPEEMARVSGIAEWVESVGGIEAALKESPLLVTIRDGKVHIEDGYHRLGVAVFYFGVTAVRAICAEMSAKPSIGMSI